MQTPRGLVFLAVLLTTTFACAAGTGDADSKRVAPKADDPAPKADDPAPKADGPAPKADGPAPPAGCEIELRTELDSDTPAWGAEAAVRLQAVNLSESSQEVVVGGPLPRSDHRCQGWRPALRPNPSVRRRGLQRRSSPRALHARARGVAHDR